MKKKILAAFIVILIGIQFFRPTRNISSGDGANEIGLHYPVPEEVHAILKKSCYDCHSNNTVYRWYFEVQPLAWWLHDHVNEGKRKLNFSEFGSYPEKKARHKFDEIEDAATNGWMPLKPYTLCMKELN